MHSSTHDNIDNKKKNIMHMFVMIEEVSWELKLMEGLYGFSYNVWHS